MRVKERIISMRIIEKAKKNPEYFAEIGVVANIKNNKEKEKKIWLTKHEMKYM